MTKGNERFARSAGFVALLALVLVFGACASQRGMHGDTPVVVVQPDKAPVADEPVLVAQAKGAPAAASAPMMKDQPKVHGFATLGYGNYSIGGEDENAWMFRLGGDMPIADKGWGAGGELLYTATNGDVGDLDDNGDLGWLFLFGEYRYQVDGKFKPRARAGIEYAWASAGDDFGGEVSGWGLRLDVDGEYMFSESSGGRGFSGFMDLGVGWLWGDTDVTFKGKTNSESDNYFQFHFEPGVAYHFNERMALGLSWLWTYFDSDELDDSLDWMGLALTFKIDF